MIKKLITGLSLAAALVLSPGALAQQKGNIAFSYDTGAGAKTFYGSNKKENYDVAIAMTDEALVGETIVGVAVPMLATEVSNLKVWLSKELTLEMIDGKKQNVPDIMSINAEVKSGWTEVALPEPYTIAEGGVYVGYSFDVDELNDATGYPVMVTTETRPGGFYIHSSRKYRSWMDASETCSSCMLVMLSGADANSVSIGDMPPFTAGAGKSTIVSLPIVNHGFQGVKNLDYTYHLVGTEVKQSGHIDLGENTIGGLYNASKNIDIELAPIAAAGEYTFNVTIDKVNGEANACATPEGATVVKVYDNLPTHRAVVEEYTGLWCGYCPRGWAAMEEMSERYPDDFIGLAYHSGTTGSFDPMAVTDNYPSYVSGFPMAFIDRASGELDPYHGSNMYSYELGIENDWKLRCRVDAPADIIPAAELSEDGTRVDMTTTVSFPIPLAETGFTVEFVLLADSLRNEKWAQVNYFEGMTDYLVNEKMRQFVEGGSKVEGLHFNDVVVATSRLAGNDARLPETIVEGDKFELPYSFDLTTIKNVYGEDIIQDKHNLRVVALLINAAGQIVNANKTQVNTQTYDSGIEDIRVDVADGKESYYDLSGRRLKSLQKGVNIVLYSNGKAHKVIIE